VLGVTGAAVPTLTFAFVAAKSYEVLTLFGTAAVVVEVEATESVSVVTPNTPPVAAVPAVKSIHCVL
jgi:hypothetical protein